MNRRTLLARLAIFFIAIAGTFAIGGRASADALVPCCPSYRVDIDCNIDPLCFPVTLETHWNGGLVWTSTYAGCGTYVETPSNPPFPPCILNYTNFQFLRLNGDPTPVPLNQPTQIWTGPCCFMVLAQKSATGCVDIRIWRC